MKKLYLVPALASALLFSTAAMAGEFGNQCAYGLSQGKKVMTDCTINGVIGGQTYCFGSKEAMSKFMSDTKGNLAKAKANFKG